MTQLVGVSGSLRKGSFNTALLRAAVSLVPDGFALEVRTLHDIPLYDGDEEAAGKIPAAASDLKEAIVRADGVIFATPEYNGSIPGVFKNGVDWLSRPVADIKRVFGGKPLALFGASPGNYGTILAQTAWLPVLRALGVNYWTGGRLFVPRAATVFDADGNLTDLAIRDQLQKFLAGFTAFVSSSR